MGTLNNIDMTIPYDDIILSSSEIAEIEKIAQSSQRFSTEEVEHFMRMNKSLSHA